MPNGTFISDSAAFVFPAANVIDSLYPSYSSILLASILGVDGATSIVNGVNDAAPMTVDGSPTYGSNFATVNYTNGIDTNQVVPGDVTIAVVGTLEAAANAVFCGSFSADAGAGANQNKGDALFYAPGSNSLRMYMGTTNAAVSTTGFAASRPRLMVGRISGTTVKVDVWNDSGAKVSATATGTRNASGLSYRLGGRNSAWGGSSKIFELGQWGSGLSDANLDAYRAYLVAKYGTSLGAPL